MEHNIQKIIIDESYNRYSTKKAFKLIRARSYPFYIEVNLEHIGYNSRLLLLVESERNIELNHPNFVMSYPGHLDDFEEFTLYGRAIEEKNLNGFTKASYRLLSDMDKVYTEKELQILKLKRDPLD